MNKNRSDSRLEAALAGLPRETLPARDLWPGIEHAIATPNAAPWPRQLALAASVVLVVSLSIWFGITQPQTAQPNPQLQAFLEALREEHLSTKEALLVKYAGQQAFYPDWEMQMRQLEQAEQTIHAALREAPDNLELLKILRQVQYKQIELIDAVFDPRLNSI